MPGQPTFAASSQWLREIYQQSEAAEFGVSPEWLAQLLADVSSRFLQGLEATTGNINPARIEEFCRGLQVKELVLARCCAEGNERAWEVFLTRYREKLYGFALQITKNDASGRDLADGIYADLYGVSSRAGERVSKLRSYSGRGSLEGWLRTVLAQAWVDRYRKVRREVSLEEQAEEGTQFAARESATDLAPSSLLAEATDIVVRGLDAEDRYILSAYFLDGRKLAEVARVLGVHESTISRRLERVAANTRKQIAAYLVKAGMSRRQAEEALETDVRDLSLDVRRALETRAPQQDLPAPSVEKKSSAKAQDSGETPFS